MTIDPAKFAMWAAMCLTNGALASMVGHTVVGVSFIEGMALAISGQLIITGSLLLNRISDS